MNICIFCHFTENLGSGAASFGGMERSSHLLAQELRRRGHHVDFYSSILKHHQQQSLIRLVAAFFRSFFRSFLPSLLPSCLAFYSPSRSERAHFHKFLMEHKTDIVIWYRVSWGFLFPMKNLPCKLITSLRTTPNLPAKTYLDGFVKKWRVRFRFGQRIVYSRPVSSLICKYYGFCRNRTFFYAVRHSDRVVLLSERFIPEFAPAKKFPHKVCAISNMAPLVAENVDFATKKKELLWVGRISFSEKRPDLMLQIWQRLQDRFPDWSLRFVGDGSYLSELKKLSSSLGLKNVYFEGFQAPAPYYRSASIFCMTSAFEGFGLVLVEAQALGCVPVAFESFSAVHDIIEDGVNGALVPAFDIEKYAEKLAELMNDPELRARLASAAQKSIAKFSLEATGDKWEKLLLEEVTD